MILFGWGSVLVVLFMRLVVEAHTVGAVLAGAGMGMLYFWITMVIFRCIITLDDEINERLLADVSQLWAVSMSGWLLLGQNKVALALMLIGGVVALQVFSVKRRVLASRTERYLVPDPLQRCSRRRYRKSRGIALGY